jgi:hypothetical protein
MRADKVIGLIGLLLKSLPREVIEDAADKVLDVIEDAIERSQTKIDDRLVLPLIELTRRVGKIPD